MIIASQIRIKSVKDSKRKPDTCSVLWDTVTMNRQKNEPFIIKV